MTNKKSLYHCVDMSYPASDHPVLLINAEAPLSDLHACASERLEAVLKYLESHGVHQPPRPFRTRHQHHHHDRENPGAGRERCISGNWATSN